MGTSLHTVNPSPEQAPDESLAGRLQEYQRHRAVIEQDLRRAGITDTTPLELADRIIGDALHSAYACMVSDDREEDNYILTHNGRSFVKLEALL